MNNQEPPKDRFCDLVMKGGTTSGVVYPRAIAELSHYYRFRSIGGTSAGAIAAAVTAAAECQRRRTGSRKGFDQLKEIPDDLAREDVPGTRKLLTLFQPQPSMRRLFSVLIWALNRKTALSRIGWIILGFLWAYWLATLVAIGIAALTGVLRSSYLESFLVFAIALPISVGWQVCADVTRRLVANNFGLCTGMAADGSDKGGLTPWLHNLIQNAAGLDHHANPLTFGDLWDAPHPPSWLEASTSDKLRSIDLQMFTTNLSHGRPYIFPLDERSSQQTKFRDRERLYFKADEMKQYLPPTVMKWMSDKSLPYSVETNRVGKDPSVDDPSATGLLELPEPRDFPILLAARMSLSFPILFSAIPLYAIDYDSPSPNRKFRRCWFSDGGISSNFPIHLFDDLIPMWPTFGLSLESKIDGRPPVFLPDRYNYGYGERWNHIPEEQEKGALGRLSKFIWAIISTMQNWNDNSLARMPGVRDRVARIRLNKDEGGLNLNMEKTLIDKIAMLGVDAAEELLKRFAIDGSEGWDDHRLVRLHVLLKMFEARSTGVLAALNQTSRHATNFSSLLNSMTTATGSVVTRVPPGYENPMTQQECQALINFIIALKNLAETTQPPTVSFKAIPSPELRVRPPL